MASSGLRSKLQALDVGSAKTQWACRHLQKQPSQLNARPILPLIEARIEALEDRLMERYRSEFERHAWHGPTSLQRVVWQDRELLGLLVEPSVARACLDRHRSGRMRALGPMTDLGSAIFGGLARNRPAYLLSVCPNWAQRPGVDGVAFDRLDDMRVPEIEQRTPFLLSDEYLDAGADAIAAIEEVLIERVRIDGECTEEQPDEDALLKEQEIWRRIDRCSSERLQTAAVALLAGDRAARLIENPAIPSTALRRMVGQCFEVLDLYPRLLQGCEGSHEHALGFGLVSHALDAKHLAAALVLTADTNSPDRDLGLGAQTFRMLMKDASLERLGPVADTLIRVRLQQVIRLISDHRDRLDLSAEELLQALA